MGIEPVGPLAAEGGPLKTLIYTSRATMPFDPPVLERLVDAARARNGSENVTGLIVFDEGRFLQWLEGPAPGLDRIAGSIRRDPRHRDITVLRHQDAAARTFSSWDMRLALRGGKAGPLASRALLPPDALIERLMHRPDEAAKLMPQLADGAETLAGPPVPQQAPPPFPAADILPRLCARIAGAPGRPWRMLRDRKPEILLQALLSDGWDTGHGKHGEGGLLPTVLLLERSAACLGDAVKAKSVDASQTAVALARMQGMLRRAAARQAAPRWTPVQPPGTALVAHLPGAPDFLGPLMKTALLRLAGWEVALDLEADMPQLEKALAAIRPDILVLTTGQIYVDRSALPALGRMVARLRAATRGLCPPIVLGGRIFADATTDWKALGADAACGSAVRILAVARTLAEIRASGRTDRSETDRQQMPA